MNSSIHRTAVIVILSSIAPIAAPASRSLRIFLMTARRRLWRSSRCARTARANMPTQRTGGSMRSRWPARFVARTFGWRTERRNLGAYLQRRGGDPGNARSAGNRAHRRGQRPGWISPGLRCDQCRSRSMNCAGANLRVDKPFALMMPDMETVLNSTVLWMQAERELLQSAARPIVLLRRRPESNIDRKLRPVRIGSG